MMSGPGHLFSAVFFETMATKLFLTWKSWLCLADLHSLHVSLFPKTDFHCTECFCWSSTSVYASDKP